MNQQALADALDLTFQQVQKYEHGANRVSAPRLAAMATILAVPISYFFADLQSDGAELSVEDKTWRAQSQRPETIKLIRLFYAISNPEIRRQFLKMAKSMAAGGARSRAAGPMEGWLRELGLCPHAALPGARGGDRRNSPNSADLP